MGASSRPETLEREKKRLEETRRRRKRSSQGKSLRAIDGFMEPFGDGEKTIANNGEEERLSHADELTVYEPAE